MNRSMMLVVVSTLLLSAVVVFGCSKQESAKPGETTIEDVKKETQEAVQAAGDVAAQEVAKLKADLQTEIDALQARLDELKQKAAAASDDAKQALEVRSAAVEASLKDARDKLAQWGSQTGESVSDMAKKIRDGLADVKKSLDEALTESPPQPAPQPAGQM